jgi:hypothetical protein
MQKRQNQTAVEQLCARVAMKSNWCAITFYIDNEKEIREAKELERKRMCDFAYYYAENLKAGMNETPEDFLEEYEHYNETHGDEDKQ